ncbi:Uncharacterised protein [Mycobacteroides abscessus subsp. abscessus]|nr:Uncharacterised protein [Mycobacteroides abscessus subsp. abscessus]
MLQLVERLVAAVMQGRWQREAADDYARMLEAGRAQVHKDRAFETAADRSAALHYLDTLSSMNPDPVLKARIVRLRAQLGQRDGDPASC